VPGEDPKARLLEAAGTVLIRDGRKGLTTRRLAREAGVNHGLIHYHFGSLDAILAELMEVFGRRWVGSLAAAVGMQGGFLDRWRTLRADLDRDVAGGESKLRAELALAAADDRRLDERWLTFLERRSELLSVLVAGMLQEYRLSISLGPPATALISAVLHGLERDGLDGLDSGQPELDRWIEGWLLALSAGADPGVRPG
jgi:AcrR family transcriptional regulator